MTRYEKNFIIIDFQWFRLNKYDFIPKELASCTNTYKKSHFVFKPPFSFNTITKEDRRVARHTTSYHHGIHWMDGYTACSAFDEIIRRLCADFDTSKVDKKWII